jgi:ankyrin repeat protein
VFLLACPPSPLSLCPLFQNGNTALNWASLSGHATVVELLLAAKADTNLKGEVSPPPPPQRERERTKDPFSPSAYTFFLTLTKG